MLFDEVAESLLGVSASSMKHDLLLKYPTLPQVLEELLVGLHVSFSFQRPAPKRNSKHSHFTVCVPLCCPYRHLLLDNLVLTMAA